jgi:hypothetical protein
VSPRHADRSSFAEYVELVITGATTTFFAVLVVLLLAGVIDFIGLEALDLSKLFGEPGAYAKDEPWRCVASASVAAVLSFVIADQAARRLHPISEGGATTYQQHTVWWDSFSQLRPEGKSVSISAELSGGIQLSGILRGFTPTESDDRELKVQRVVLRRAGTPPAEFPKDHFLLLRESQLRYLIGEYVQADE